MSTAARPMARRTANPPLEICSRPTRRILYPGVEVERHTRDLHLVAGLEARTLEGADHADPAQPPLQVPERVLVVEVVAREQPLDAAPADAEAVLAGPLHGVAAVGGGAEDAVLGQRLELGNVRGRLGLGCAHRHPAHQLDGKLVQPQAAHRGGDDHRRVLAQALAPLGPATLARGLVDQVGLRQGEHARQGGQAGIVQAELVLDRGVVGHRIGAVERLQVEHVHEHARALDVGQELVAQPRPRAGALDQSGDVGDHELAILELERPEHRLERREWVPGDLGVRAGQAREQRGLARVGEPDQPNVGQQLQLERQPALLPRETPLGEARRLVGGTREALVAAPARAAAGHHRALPGPGEVVARPVGLDQHLGARGHPYLERLAVLAVAQRALAVAAAAGLEVRAPAKALQVAQRVVAHEHDVPPAPAVPPVGSSLGHVRLATEAETTVAAGAGLDVDTGSILHCHDPGMSVFLITGASSGIGAATARAAAQAGYRLVLAARSLDRLEALSEELGGPERALAVRCDVTEWEDQQALAAKALERFGAIDVVFANAGFGAPRGFQATTVEHWRSMVLTNVYGAALTVRATIDALRSSRGHLILTGSVAGRRALPGSLYSATKWAVTAMGEAARQELDGTGVRVTLIEPGAVDTPFFDNGAGPGSLQADDIARTVMFAVSQPAHVDVNEILVRPTAQSG